VAGGGTCTVMDREGREHALGSLLTNGWAYDVDVSPDGSLICISYSHGHCILFDGVSFQKIVDLSHGFTGVRKVKFSPSGNYFATACDNKTLHVFDVKTRERLHTHTEPYDVNAVAWLDEQTIVFQTDMHVGRIAHTGGKPQRKPAGGADVTVAGGLIWCGTSKHGVLALDPATLKTVESYPVANAARVRLSADQKLVLIASYSAGMHVVVRGTKRIHKVHDEELFGLAMDPQTSRVWCGGKSHRVTVLEPDGARLAIATETAQYSQDDWMPAPAATRKSVRVIAGSDGEVQALDAAGHFIKLRLQDQRAQVLCAPPRALPSDAESAQLFEDGLTVIADFDCIVALRDGQVAWTRNTQRCERFLAFGDVLVVPSGKHIAFLDRTDGRLLGEHQTHVESSWIEYLHVVDADTFLLMGYDEPVLQLWSVSKQRRVADHRIAGHAGSGRFSRPYGLCVHAPSARLWVSHWDNALDIYSLRHQTIVRERRLQLHKPFENLDISPDGKWLLLGDATEAVVVGSTDAEARWRYKSKAKLTCHAFVQAGPGAEPSVVVGTETGSVLHIASGAKP
jgi:WD domain, G-beta repeat